MSIKRKTDELCMINDKGLTSLINESYSMTLNNFLRPVEMLSVNTLQCLISLISFGIAKNTRVFQSS